MKKHVIINLVCGATLSTMAMDGLLEHREDVYINVSRMFINNDFRLSIIEDRLNDIKSSSLLEQVMKIQPVMKEIRAITVENPEEKFISYNEGYMPLHQLISILEVVVNHILSQVETRDKDYRKYYTVPRTPIEIDFNLSDQFIKKENLADKEVILPFKLPAYSLPDHLSVPVIKNYHIDEVATKNLLRNCKMYESDDESDAKSQTVIIKHDNSPSDSILADEHVSEELPKKKYFLLMWFGSRIGLSGIIAALAYCMYTNLKKGTIVFIRKTNEIKQVQDALHEPSYMQECTA